MSAALTTRIPIKNKNGQVIDEKEVATYAGLLACGHDEGLKSIQTELLQVPHGDNGEVAIVRAVIETDKGVFTGIGDASPQSVGRRIVPHIIRMAETRAKARALRDAVNIGVVALEELGGDIEPTNAREASNVRQLPQARAHRREPFPRGNTGDRRRGGDQMTDRQRHLIFRLLAERGYHEQAALQFLLEHTQHAEISQVSKREASDVIDSLTSDGGRRA